MAPDPARSTSAGRGASPISRANASADSWAACSARGSSVTAGHVGLSGCHADPEWGWPAERLRTRIAGLEYSPLDLDTRCYSRRGRAYFHHDLPPICQVQPDHGGQVAGPEQLRRGSTAEMIRAPRSEAGRIDGRSTWWHLPSVTHTAATSFTVRPARQAGRAPRWARRASGCQRVARSGHCSGTTPASTGSADTRRWSPWPRPRALPKMSSGG